MELLHVGQWQGFYKYGSTYSPEVEGHEVEFRLFIEEYHEGIFSGRIIDWSGLGADGEISVVEGFTENGFISFTKTYAEKYSIDEWGRGSIEEGEGGYTVTYQGRFNHHEGLFEEAWELTMLEEHKPESTEEWLMTGTWIMRANDY
jgi:hypothetical protein